MNNETAGIPASLVPPDIAGADIRQSVDEKQPVLLGRKFIVFVLGGSRFAVDSQYVSEVLRDLSPVPIQNTPSWLLGIANLRSEIVTVVDLARALGQSPEASTEGPKHIVVRLESMDAHIAFRVEKLREIVTIDKSQVKPAPAECGTFDSAVFDHKDGRCTVINIGKLVDSLRLTK